MQLLKKICVLIFVICTCLLAAMLYLDNSQPEVAIRLFGYSSSSLSIGYWIIIFFSGGLLLGIVVNFFMSMKSALKIRKLEKRLKYQQAELDLLKSKNL